MKLTVEQNTQPILASAVDPKGFSFASGGGGGGGGVNISFGGGAQMKNAEIAGPAQAPSTAVIMNLSMALSHLNAMSGAMTINYGGPVNPLPPPVHGYDIQGSNNTNFTVNWILKVNGVQKAFHGINNQNNSGPYSFNDLLNNFLDGTNVITLEQVVAGNVVWHYNPNGQSNPDPQPADIVEPVIIMAVSGEFNGMIATLV
jgi:hypothetical protein